MEWYKKWYFWVLIGIGIVVVVAAAFLVIRENRNELNNSSSETVSAPATVVFTHKMFDTEKVKNIGTLGELNGGYYEVQTLNGLLINNKREAVKDSPLEVYAPTDMELFSYAHTSTNDRPEGDWQLEFRINKNLEMTIHHLNNADKKITDVVGNNATKDDSRGISIKNPIKFKAGELIGTTRGTGLANNWNIYLYDKNVKNQFVNQKRFEEDRNLGSRFINAACFFDYYSDDIIKNSFYALLGASAPGQTKSCGSSSKDIQGTLSGLWFLTESGFEAKYDGNYATPLSVYKRSDGIVIINELGKSNFSIEANNSSYKDPAQITASHCYSLTDSMNPKVSKGYAYFRIDSDMEMSAIYSTAGSCPAEFPVENAKKYYR